MSVAIPFQITREHCGMNPAIVLHDAAEPNPKRKSPDPRSRSTSDSSFIMLLECAFRPSIHPYRDIRLPRCS